MKRGFMGSSKKEHADSRTIPSNDTIQLVSDTTVHHGTVYSNTVHRSTFHPGTIHPTSIDTVHPPSIDTVHLVSIDTVHPDTVHYNTVHPDTIHSNTVYPDTVHPRQRRSHSQQRRTVINAQGDVIPDVIAVAEMNDFDLSREWYDWIGQDPFQGLSHQDPRNHIEELEDLVSRSEQNEVSEYHMLCKIFPYSICGDAFRWFSQVQPGSLTSWDDIERAFLYKFLDDAEATREKEKNDKWDMFLASLDAEYMIPVQLLDDITAKRDEQHVSGELSKSWTSTSTDGRTLTSTDGKTSMSTDGTTSTSTDGTTSTLIDGTTSTSTNGTNSMSIDDVEKEITMEDFLDLEEFLELEDGEKFDDLDSSREASHLAVPKHQRPPIWTEEADGLHNRVKRIHDHVKIVVPCAVFEAESPIPPDRSMKFSSYIEVLDLSCKADLSNRHQPYTIERHQQTASIDIITSPSIDTRRVSELKEFDVCGNLRDGETTTRSDKSGGKKRKNWKKRKRIMGDSQLSLIPRFSDGVRKSRVKGKDLRKTSLQKDRRWLCSIDRQSTTRIDRHLTVLIDTHINGRQFLSTSTDETSSISIDCVFIVSNDFSSHRPMRPCRYQSTALHQQRLIVSSLCRSTLSRSSFLLVESEQDLVAKTIKACFIRIPTKRIRTGLGGGNHQERLPAVLLEDKQKELHRRVRCLAMDGDLPTVILSPCFDTRYKFALAFQCHQSEVNQYPVADFMPVLLKSSQSATREEAVEEMNDCRSMKKHWCR
uniref:Retrotransposon gag domain-containing protein n=1 Tax=Brassica oleracea var. oleracea TaxID=109376 RepID=A0A0D3CQ49_BRAOL